MAMAFHRQKQAKKKGGIAAGMGSAAVAGRGHRECGRAEITAVFRPDPANPMINKFINTTP